jgi:ABC-type transporter Mla subunit MlaD
MAHREICQLAYLNSQERSLKQTSALFKKLADDLDTATAEVNRKATQLKNSIEAVKLLVDIARLASALALAFG